MITDANDIIARCESLAAGGWHPTHVALEWWSDIGWSLCIEMQDWIGLNTPPDELPVCYDLPVPYHVRAEETQTISLPAGVTMLGGRRAPAYREEISQAEAWHEQAEAIISALWRDCDGDMHEPTAGHSDLRATPHRARHRWHRCTVWRWASDSSREIRERADALQVERVLAQQPTPEDPVKVAGAALRVLRPCGCVTEHRRAPGRGHGGAAAKLRFGAWLAGQPCLKCLTAQPPC